MPVQNRPPRRFLGWRGHWESYVEVAMKSLLLSISLVLLAGGAMAEDASHTNVIAPDALKCFS